MSKNSDPSRHLPLSVPVYQILLSLSDRELHGYAVIQDIRRRTEGEVDLTASTLYAAVKRMLQSGLISEVGQPRGGDWDSRRRSYRLTPAGRALLELEAGRLKRAVRMAVEKRILPAGTS